MVFTAKDPLVLGVGYSATRDVISFFHHALARTHVGLGKARDQVAAFNARGPSTLPVTVELMIADGAGVVRGSSQATVRATNAALRH
jgi:hypothetical protein